MRLAQAPADGLDRLVELLGNPILAAVLRYLIGVVIALYVVALGWLVSFVRPTRRSVYRVFNLLPWLLLGDYAPLTGIVAPAQDGSRIRWLWLVAIGWWASYVWATLAWLAIVGVVTVPVGMWMLGQLDRVLFMPYVPKPKRKSEFAPPPIESRRSPDPPEIRPDQGPVVDGLASPSVLAVVPDPAEDIEPLEADTHCGEPIEPRFERIPIPKRLRFRVLARDGFRCQYCGRSQAEGARLEIDHRVPVARGGTNDVDNLVTACLDCNRGKGALDLEAIGVA